MVDNGVRSPPCRAPDCARAQLARSIPARSRPERRLGDSRRKVAFPPGNALLASRTEQFGFPMSGYTVNIPRLETARLLMREYRQSDFEDFAEFYSTERSAFIGGPLTREMAWRGLATHLGHWALRGYGFWAVEEKDTGRFCGHVGLWFPEGWYAPEVGWVMIDHAEGRGIALEAALSAREFAWVKLGWKTAVSMIDPANSRSIRLAQRLGCEFEGMFEHRRLGPMQIWRHPAPE